ncbi:MAG: response regulator [Agarilytica sp.]
MSNIDILLVEDNPADARLTFEALKDGKLANYKQIHHVTDGEQAINFLTQQPPYETAIRPDLVLLDINMPKVNGMEVLKYIREHETLSGLPVVMLTTSQSEEDIMRSYDLHANCYVSKPVDFQTFVDVVGKIEDFWFTVVKLPKPRN